MQHFRLVSKPAQSIFHTAAVLNNHKVADEDYHMNRNVKKKVKAAASVLLLSSMVCSTPSVWPMRI